MRISDWSSDVCSSDLSSGRVQKEWFGNVPAVKQGLDELLTSQTSENPAEREAQIDEYLETALRGFALDQESGAIRDRSEERRVGTECVSKCRHRWSQDH